MPCQQKAKAVILSNYFVTGYFSILMWILQEMNIINNTQTQTNFPGEAEMETENPGFQYLRKEGPAALVQLVEHLPGM